MWPCPQSWRTFRCPKRRELQVVGGPRSRPGELADHAVILALIVVALDMDEGVSHLDAVAVIVAVRIQAKEAVVGGPHLYRWATRLLATHAAMAMLLHAAAILSLAARLLFVIRPPQNPLWRARRRLLAMSVTVTANETEVAMAVPMRGAKVAVTTVTTLLRVTVPTKTRLAPEPGATTTIVLRRRAEVNIFVILCAPHTAWCPYDYGSFWLLCIGMSALCVFATRPLGPLEPFGNAELLLQFIQLG
mmetsp:Transcript_107687/g.229911  ORF Transcript_107687/g.229911 Transcript_107687/m.229911 type:complete len:247 (-) Transcript_107687:576-1316(-)